jgi:hypothetical protein
VDAIDRRVDIRLIESKDREIDLSELTPEEDNALVRIKTSPLYEQRKREKIQLLLYITESSCILCFPLRDDQYDYTGFICDDDAALEWCNDLYNYYWEPITSRVSRKSLKKEIQEDDLVEKKVAIEELDDLIVDTHVIQKTEGTHIDENIEETLNRAKEQEKKYKWLEAYELYDKALKTCDKDYSRKGEIQEKIGYSLYRAAFQNEQEEDFLNGVKEAIDAYSLAQNLYERIGYDQGLPWMFRCEAMSKYLEHWIVPDASEKLSLLNECYKLKGEALDIFWKRKEISEYCRTYTELMHVTDLLFHREWDPQKRRAILERELSSGENALNAASSLDDPYIAAKVNVTYVRYLEEYWTYIEPSWNIEVLRHHFNNALRYAEEIGDQITKARCYVFMGVRGTSIISKESHNYLLKALEFTEKTGDIFLKAQIFSWIAYAYYWTAFTIEDPEQRIERADKAMEYYDKSQSLVKILSFQFPHKGKNLEPDPGGYAEYYLDRAEWETDVTTKREFLIKSEKLGITALENAEKLSQPNSIGLVSNVLSRAFTSRARLETDLETKKSLLKKAMVFREKNIEILELFSDFITWNRGVGHIYLGQTKMELSQIEKNQSKRIELLEEAMSSTRKGLDWCHKLLPTFEREGNLGNLGILSEYQDGYGKILVDLYELTKNKEYLKTAIETWYHAIELANKVPLLSRVAELYWNIAKTHEIITEYKESTETFRKASESYLMAANNVPQLNSFYQDYSTYMRAWSEIEKARQCHSEKQYGEAKFHYEKAAELHEKTRNWNYMTPNYNAWAKLEEAEDLSRDEKLEEAKEEFQEAARLFDKARESIRKKLKTIETIQEKQTAEDLIIASDTRREYCIGRITLENAQILYRQGDYLASSKKYGESAKLFQEVMDSIVREPDKKEIQLIIYLCKAWEKMIMAEARSQPTLYTEAAENFELAWKSATEGSTSYLAQAHSSFCKALEAGLRFERDRDFDLFLVAKNHIEAAISHYLRARDQNMSDYARATGRILDAYQYTYNAQTEVDPVKKTRFYQMAEKLFQFSLEAYLQVKRPEKVQEVNRVLSMIKEEREIASSLSEILHPQSTMSTTKSFRTPSPTHERAIGLERFENADIQANLLTEKKEIGIGDELNLEIDMVNSGKVPAQLIKVENVIIEGFDLKSHSDIYRVEEGFLDLKGRNLSPLKTLKLKLSLQSLSKGIFEFKPRVLYLDGAGNYRIYDIEPFSITVIK